LSDNYSYLRHQPRQQRSIDRFHHILDTASQLFAEVGYENVTTNHIAEAAEVAVGSVYHFFPNKETLLRALAERYEKQLVAVFPVDVAPPRPLLDVLDEMLDNLMAFMAAKSGVEWMLDKAEMPGSPEGPHALHEQIVGWVDHLLAAHFPAIPDDRRRLCAASGFAVIKGMMMLLHPPHNVSPEVFKVEAKDALLGYMARFLAREGIEPPF